MIKRRSIVWFLILPLLAAAVFSLLGSYWASGWNRDLLLGLGTTFLGFLLAVGYVDGIVQGEWTGVRLQAAERLLNATDGLATQLKLFAYSYASHDLARRGELEGGKPPSDPSSELLCLVETTLKEQGPKIFGTASAQSAQNLAGSVRDAEVVIAGIVAHHWARMSPEVVEAANIVVPAARALAFQLDRTPAPGEGPSASRLGSISAEMVRRESATREALRLVCGMIALVDTARLDARPGRFYLLQRRLTGKSRLQAQCDTY